MKPSHFLLSDVISKCITFSQHFPPPSDPPPTRPDSSLRYRRYKNHLLTYLLTYKHSLTFRVLCYVHICIVQGYKLTYVCVVIATNSVHRLQIRPTVHSWRAPTPIPPSYIRVCAVVWECSEGQTDRYTERHAHRWPWPVYILPRLCLTRNVNIVEDRAHKFWSRE